MASKCPQCMAKVPAGMIVAQSYGMECPDCHARLEVTPGARYIGAAAGLITGVLVYRFARGSGGLLWWALPIVYAFIAFGVISPLIVMMVADLQVAPPEPRAITYDEATGAAAHGGGHH
jgi:hypothetical protein